MGSSAYEAAPREPTTNSMGDESVATTLMATPPATAVIPTQPVAFASVTLSPVAATPITTERESAAPPESLSQPEAVIEPEPATTVITAAESASVGSVWPGLTAAGLPTRTPRDGDSDSDSDSEELKEAFFASWEAPPTSPTPLTRKPFTPTYLDEPAQPWSRAGLASSSVPGLPWTIAPQSMQPPNPAEPPEPRQPPEPKEPPAPPTPPPGPFPSPFPSPVPNPPVPVPPTPIPPGPPVPTPPPPFPAPPGPVPPPPAIIPGARLPLGDSRAATADPDTVAVIPARSTNTTVHQGGRYTDLQTEAITGVVMAPGQWMLREPLSGSLNRQLLTVGVERTRRRERHEQWRRVAWVAGSLLTFGIAIAVIVQMLAGNFIASLIKTFAEFAR